MMNIKYVFPFLLGLAIVACKKPPDPVSITDIPQNEKDGFIVFRTSLADSLSAKAMETLNVGKVTGIKIKYLSGHERQYFVYDADERSVIRALSQLKFTPYGKYSDTICRKINPGELTTMKQSISTAEYENSSFFWDVDAEKFDLYECIKSPYKHTLLVDPKSNRVLHRIELIAYS